MKTFKDFMIFLENSQNHTGADTSLNQISAGLKDAAGKLGLIKPNSLNIDNGGGRYDLGKDHVEKTVDGAVLHVHDPFNRSEEHNEAIKKVASGKADYVGMHNVLNVIKEPEYRRSALETAKSFMKPGGIAHFTVYEGDKSGNGRISKPDRGRGSSWQEHRPTSSYMSEVREVFPEETHEVQLKGKNIIVRHLGGK